MKININKIRTTPANQDFAFCVFGKPNEEIQSWIEHWNLPTEESGKFTNILIPEGLDISELFENPKEYKYVDGFSPNLNKHLHIGHLSNLIIASALQKMGIGENFISIMGDTLEGEVKNEDAFLAYHEMCKKFNYKLGDIFFASNMEYEGDLLKDGEGEYEGTKYFQIGEDKIVGIKSDGSTSYFYQDVALASHLNAPTLYLTGFEQKNHFNMLSELFPENDHLGLGLVMIDGQKMSSREGNVIYASEAIDKLMVLFDDEKIVSNILRGQILKSKLEKTKNITTENLDNPKNSPGLYLSYTEARFKSAGMISYKTGKWESNRMHFAYLKALHSLSPDILLSALNDLCKDMNSMYGTHKIEGNPENKQMFQPYMNDLYTGMKLLGFHSIDSVIRANV
jgi:arginyl-tRNA synthetase